VDLTIAIPVYNEADSFAVPPGALPAQPDGMSAYEIATPRGDGQNDPARFTMLCREMVRTPERVVLVTAQRRELNDSGPPRSLSSIARPGCPG